MAAALADYLEELLEELVAPDLGPRLAAKNGHAP